MLFDHREARSGIPAALVAAGIEMRPEQLPAGDYIVSERLVVERKTGADLAASIKDRRLFEQIDRLNTSFEAVPEGFVPAGATPLEDFLAKFVAIKYVIDPGTRQEQTYVYPTSDKLWIDTIAGFPAVWPGTLSNLQPLSVGEHFVVVYWVFNAMHCDGFGTVVEENCLGPGEVAYVALGFEVISGALQSR